MSEPLEAIRESCRKRIAACSTRQRRLAGLFAVYAAAYLLIDAGAVTRGYLLTPLNNLNVAEASAWLDGRLDIDTPPDLGRRPWDSALVDGKVYNVFPPLFTLIAAAVMTVVRDGVPHVILVLIALPIPGLAYAVFLRRTERASIAALLAVGLVLGTSLLPVMNRALRDGEVWYVNHTLSQLGLLIFLLDYFGKRRIWLGGLGLIIAAWSRQLSAIYLLPLAYAAWAAESQRSPRFRWGAVAATTVVLVALPAALNWARFGTPLESGYHYIYEGRFDDPDDPPARAVAEHGVFNAAYVPRNLYYTNIGLPHADEPLWMLRFVPNAEGTGIWWTTPLLLFLFLYARAVWADRDARVLLVAAALVFGVLMFYHTTGRAQLGFNRFSLDFVPVLMAAIAPQCDRPNRRWWVLALVLWSVWYFRFALG